MNFFSAILDQFEISIPKAKTLSCQMWMQKGSRMYTGILCHGEERTLQGHESDVQLFIPQYVHGLLISSVCTDNSEFSHQIPDDECIIGPMVGFQLHSKYEHDH